MVKIRNEGKKEVIVLILVCTIFFSVSLYCLFKYGDYFLLGSMVKMDNDDVKYIRSAVILLNKGSLVYRYVNHPTVYIMPGLPVVLSAFIKVFGKLSGVVAFRVFQAFIQTLSLILIFIICKKVFNKRIALIGVVLDTLYMPEVSASGFILTEVLFKFLLLLLILISINALQHKMKTWYLIGGLVWALAMLLRPTIAVYPLAVVFVWVIYKYPIRDIMKYSAIVLVTSSIVMSPWWIRNYRDFHRFIPLTLSSGNPFLQGTYINYEKDGQYTPYKSSNDEITSNENEVEAGRYRLKNYFKNAPIKYILWYSVGKTAYLWHYPFYWRTVLGIPFIQVLRYHILLLIFGIYGVLKNLNKRNKWLLLMVIFIAIFNIAHLPYMTLSRYAFPIMPLTIILAAAGIYDIISYITGKLQRRIQNVQWNSFSGR